MPQKLERINERFVLLCEGQHDSEFFTHLSAAYPGIPKFTIASVNFVLGITHGGNTRFADALNALTAVPGFEQVERLLIVADNDVNPATEFQAVVNAINAAAPILGPPASRFVAPPTPQVKAGGAPYVVVLMIPWTNVAGNLDTMCLAAAMANAPAPMPNCVNDFALCANVQHWPITSLAKMKFRSFLAASWQTNPYISPTHVWSNRTNLVPLTDPTFNGIVDFLRRFPTL